MSDDTAKKTSSEDEDTEKAEVTLPGVVEKVIPPTHPSQPEKAQIAVEGADDLYRELRVVNTLQDADGNNVKLIEGAEVEVTIAADPEATVAKDPADSNGTKKSKHANH